GLINVDFADVRTVMSEMGMAMMGTGVARGNSRAQEAAESAVASPLLENVDLSGARGILVNITAGLDMAIGEFEEVGNTIKAFASENATVVVGTVIDQDMDEELRVTVVATGLGNPLQQSEKPMKLVNKRLDGRVDYNKLERPTVMRKSGSNSRYAGIKSSDDYFDIPAFLRRQAD
ncbi:MAG: cell division protein FtsZ, partial [Thiohalomonadales bacterium]